MTHRDPLYSDFDLSLTRNPLTGDCAAVTNEAAVRRCITRVVKTRHFDIPYEPDKAAFIEEFLFDPVNVTLAAAIKDRLDFALKKMEPRAEYRITVTPRTGELGTEEQGYDVYIHYKILSLMIEGDINQFLERVR